jgi:hypothetical protein
MAQAPRREASHPKTAGSHGGGRIVRPPRPYRYSDAGSRLADHTGAVSSPRLPRAPRPSSRDTVGLQLASSWTRDGASLTEAGRAEISLLRLSTKPVGWAKLSVPTKRDILDQQAWARRMGAFAHPTLANPFGGRHARRSGSEVVKASLPAPNRLRAFWSPPDHEHDFGNIVPDIRGHADYDRES